MGRCGSSSGSWSSLDIFVGVPVRPRAPPAPHSSVVPNVFATVVNVRPRQGKKRLAALERGAESWQWQARAGAQGRAAAVASARCAAQRHGSSDGRSARRIRPIRRGRTSARCCTLHELAPELRGMDSEPPAELRRGGARDVADAADQLLAQRGEIGRLRGRGKRGARPGPGLAGGPRLEREGGEPGADPAPGSRRALPPRRQPNASPSGQTPRELPRSRRARTVDRGLARHHFPRRRASPDVAGAAAGCGGFAVAVVGAAAARTVPTSCLCSQSR